MADERGLAAGQRIGRYEIVSALGAGGMGDVYLAQDATLGRRVALKFLPAEVANEPDRLRRFELEARAASALNHPNIITIHEIGDAGGRPFIVSEFVEGQTLRQRMKTPIAIAEVLAIAEQTTSALAAAHDAGIVHRDIKPENIMLRPDGYVKVVDFGLAKVADSELKPSDETRADVRTTAGVVLGTVLYMSPEQARGQAVDARSDLWSLGVVMYELVSGRTPFARDTPMDTVAAILTAAPPPLESVASSCPAELQRIVQKLLRSDRDARYQTAKDLLADLRALKAKNEFAGLSTRATPRRWLPALAVIALLGVGAWLYFWRLGHRPSTALAEKDTVLVTDFDNSTGDGVFDGTLKQGLTMQLQQSPFLSVFPETGVRETLRQMRKPDDAKVTLDLGREVAQRHDLKAVIAGGIAPLGSHYVITLRAINASSGDVIASAQEDASTKDDILKALSASVSGIREKLGESLSSIKQSDVPLYQWTTSSLEALQAFARAFDRSNRGKYFESIPLFRRATELDSDFAYGYALLAGNYTIIREPGLAASNAAKAYALRDRVTGREKLYIEGVYQNLTLGDFDKGAEEFLVYDRSYPNDFRASGNLSYAYLQAGQFEKAIDAAKRSTALNPNVSAWHVTLGTALLRLNRFSEARDAFDRAIRSGLDDIRLHAGLCEIAAINGDAAEMQKHLEWARGAPDEYVAVDWRTNVAAAAGRWREAQMMSRRSIDLATRPDAKGVAAQYAAEEALRAAAFGRCDEAGAAAGESIKLEKNQVSLPRATLALAVCGAADRVQPLTVELAKGYDNSTLVNAVWLPAIRSALALAQNHTGQAIDALGPAERYEPAAEFWPQYLRGLALLKLNKGSEAAAEFERIRAHRGEAPLSVLYPLASLGLSRAYASAGDAAKSAQALNEFLGAWKDGDADLPALREARARAR